MKSIRFDLDQIISARLLIESMQAGFISTIETEILVLPEDLGHDTVALEPKLSRQLAPLHMPDPVEHLLPSTIVHLELVQVPIGNTRYICRVGYDHVDKRIVWFLVDWNDIRFERPPYPTAGNSSLG